MSENNPQLVALEAERLALQARLDGEKTALARNQRGQVATPPALAEAVTALGLAALGPRAGGWRALDPAAGTGAFVSALLRAVGPGALSELCAVELDAHYGAPAAALWASQPVAYVHGDFFDQPAEGRFDLLLSNPPYVRHHHLQAEQKRRLVARSSALAGAKVSARAGLYVHFMLAALGQLRAGGVAVWLVPSEFFDVQYGDALKAALLRDTTLLRLHQADPTEAQFRDALVSSAVLCLRSGAAPAWHLVEISVGGTLDAPARAHRLPQAALGALPKWSHALPRAAAPPTPGPGQREPAGPPLGALFEVKRGLVTGDNAFFTLSGPEAEARGLPAALLRPLLPGPRDLEVDVVYADPDGSPRLPTPRYLLDCRLSPEALQAAHPAAFAHLKAAEARVSAGYLCSRRRPWYAQERRSPAPLLCTYMGRGRGEAPRPFRFIRNHSAAVAPNVYLGLHPRPGVAAPPEALDALWRHLNALPVEALTRAGRVYGGGLYKLEPSELAALRIPRDLAAALDPTGARSH